MTVPAVTVTAQTPIGTALRLMQDGEFTSIPVVDDQGEVIGVVCETDVVEDSTTPARQVGDITRRQTVTVRADDDIAAAVDRMRSTLTVPVVANHRVVGTVCHDDLAEVLAGAQIHPEFSAGTACPHPEEC